MEGGSVSDQLRFFTDPNPDPGFQRLADPDPWIKRIADLDADTGEKFLLFFAKNAKGDTNLG